MSRDVGVNTYILHSYIRTPRVQGVGGAHDHVVFARERLRLYMYSLTVTDELNLLADRSSLLCQWPKEVGVNDA